MIRPEDLESLVRAMDEAGYDFDREPPPRFIRRDGTGLTLTINGAMEHLGWLKPDRSDELGR